MGLSLARIMLSVIRKIHSYDQSHNKSLVYCSLCPSSYCR